MDSFGLGPVPYDEQCAQVGSEDYMVRARIECNAFVNQLDRLFPDSPPGAYFRVKSNPHDFGSYLEVECRFNDEDEECVAFAIKAENNTPANWDEAAKTEIMLKELNRNLITSQEVDNAKKNIHPLG